jgi:hypothetical protein
MSLKIPPAPKRKSRLTVAPPKPETVSNHLSEPSDAGVLTDMNFKVAPAVHRRFKVEASMRGMSMKELLEAMMKFYFEAHGGSMDRISQALIDQ